MLNTEPASISQRLIRRGLLTAAAGLAGCGLAGPVVAGPPAVEESVVGDRLWILPPPTLPPAAGDRPAQFAALLPVLRGDTSKGPIEKSCRGY